MTNRTPGPGIGIEYWFARRLSRPDLFSGITTADVRRDRIRDTILSRNLADTHLGTNREGKRETFGEAFARIYGHPLTTKENETCST